MACTVFECNNKHYAKGFCTKHYQRLINSGSTDDRAVTVGCYVENCDGKHKAKGLCLKHYHRMLRHGDPHHVDIIVGDDKKRLLSSVSIDVNGCWNWLKHKKRGYGVVNLKGVIEQSHRAAWKVFVGDIPKGMQINHKCNNSACINPDHLYVGDQKQNMEDMYRAKRNNNPQGEKNGNSKLLNIDAAKIKRLIINGFDNKSISEMFTVSSGCIQFIRRGLTWREVQPLKGEYNEF